MPRRLALFSVLALLMGAVCVRLGFWQLSRLAEKRAANAAVHARLAARAVPLESLPSSPDSARWRRVRLAGTLDFTREALLGNRTYRGSPGAYLLTPLRRAGTDTAVIVNRGWVYAPDGRSVDLSRWREDSVARGEAYVELFPTAPGRGAANVASDTMILRRLEAAPLARRTGSPLAPYYLVLLDDTRTRDTGSAASRAGRLGAPALDEGSHLSYAIQWFSFAAIAVIGVGSMLASERRSRS